MQFPISTSHNAITSIVTSSSNCASLWRAREVSHKEACSAFTLTDRMQEESANMTEAMLAATLSTTAPLSLLEQYYGSVETCVTSYWRSCPKAGGNAMSADMPIEWTPASVLPLATIRHGCLNNFPSRCSMCPCTVLGCRGPCVCHP